MFDRKIFARKVSVRLKPNTLEKFTSLVESEILPWLRTQEGFLDLVTLALSDGSEVQALTFWDKDAIVQAYNCGGFPAVVQILQDILDGVPQVKTFEVVNSTLERCTPPPTEAGGDVYGSAPPPSYRS